MNLNDITFLLSVHGLDQLPEDGLPEFAFAGRSNVGKSSLMNTLLRRSGFVKVSGRPGKTQGLNFFQAAEDCMLVDLPGYGFARVSKEMQNNWQKLITSYISEREALKCVVVIIDIRHEPKALDRQLLDWLREQKVPVLPIYTKIDKLSGNQLSRHAAILDAGHGIKKDERILFSSKTGQGRDELIAVLESYLA
ncbi:ribosome biogenesis GTP-binding protein YihA/YsxC [Desulfotalea psychrophila]|uniref:Probable GTP-binding protein EngB n=1 Tax=Desulfotalea psychrophila (strain LSv54 / DSM 12343) TaxID=177439 RepID=ENGB_DESPS|nr:ribosome biogenesis GTP-binding protein YihA/YsxC [Desulfotalea psychrophila]Q6AJW0.1 RecName: Full=Probable GTP-binding protein EngB [Desulfotalea psychrophila LSv54]CAG37366.1 conserved hypothetical GTP-binding protein [Desulfotalea psychrophila LSv54]